MPDPLVAPAIDRSIASLSGVWEVLAQENRDREYLLIQNTSAVNDLLYGVSGLTGIFELAPLASRVFEGNFIPSEQIFVLGTAGQPVACIEGSRAGATDIRAILATWDTDVQALFDAMTVQPSDEQKERYNRVITRLKIAGLWAKVLAWWSVGETEQASRLNFKNPATHTITIEGAPVFTANRDWSCDAVDDALNLNFNPSLHATQDNLGFYVWSRTTAAVTLSIGESDATPDGVTLLLRNAANNSMQGRVNQTTVTQTGNNTVLDASGLFHVNRGAPNSVQLGRNGVDIAASSGGSQASTTPNNLPLRLNTNGLTGFAGYRYAGAACFTATTPAERAEIYDIFNEYVVAIGAAFSQLADASWGAWLHPQVKSDGNYAVFSKVESADGDQIVVRINNETLQIQDVSATLFTGHSFDDHNALAVDFLPDGRLIAAGTGHNADTVRFWKSTDGSPVNFGAAVNATPGLSSTTYCQIFQQGGDLYISTREGLPDWELYKSEDEGATWTRKKRLINITGQPTENQIYMRPGFPGGGIVRFFTMPNQINEQNELKVFEWNKATGDVSDNTGVIGNIEDGTPTVAIANFAAMPAIRTPAAGHSLSIYDVLDDGSKVIVSDFVTADNSLATYYLGLLTGGNRFVAASWTWRPIVAAGAGFDARAFGGGKIAREPHSGIRVYIARDNGAGTYLLEQYDSSDEGQNWTLTRTIRSHSTVTIRPQAVINAPPQLPIIWHEGTYTSATSQNLTARWGNPP